MPTYEYICEACQNEFEQFQSIKADAIKECPVCHKLEVRRKISGGAAILFKGGGFYETDYRSDGYKESAKKDAEAGAPPKGESKTEAGKSDGAKTDSTKSEVPKTDGVKSESASAAPKVDAPKSDSGSASTAKKQE